MSAPPRAAAPADARRAGADAPQRLAGPLVLLLVLLPALLLAYRTAVGDLGTDPVETLARTTGIWALRFLLVALLVTPLRRALGWGWLVRHRRTLGVASFAYATVHLLVYLVVDQGLAPDFIVEDVVEHPWVLIGVLTWLLLLPLAVTSTRGWTRRLGGRRWQRLHRLAYLAAVGGAAHFYLAVKRDVREPLAYAAIVAALLGYRVWARRRRTA